MDLCGRLGLGTPREWAVRLTAGLLLGVFLGAIGPFGTYDRPLALRLAAWTLGVCLGVVLFSAAVRLARGLARGSDVPLWFATGAAVAVAAAPYSAALGLLFSPRYWLHGGWPAWLDFYGDCLLIAAPVTVGWLALPRRDAPAQASAIPADADAARSAVASAATPAPGDFLDRLPPRLGRELTALQMEDHYVRAHTSLGSDLLLMPMGQAVDALGAVEGLRVHRSWWVARRAVRGWAWRGRNLRLKLEGGVEAPVARAQVASLRAAGWLGSETAHDPSAE